ncbi:hypothetical protein Ddc_01390 [Ditylenchus destructor]|nr:hypothetical protein Ddc_01390 [Ditylenchus destructor]
MDDSIICCICSWAGVSVDQLESHLAIRHFNSDPYQCEQCLLNDSLSKFPTEAAVKRHMTEKHGTQKFWFRVWSSPEIDQDRIEIRKCIEASLNRSDYMKPPRMLMTDPTLIASHSGPIQLPEPVAESRRPSDNTSVCSSTASRRGTPSVCSTHFDAEELSKAGHNIFPRLVTVVEGQNSRTISHGRVIKQEMMSFCAGLSEATGLHGYDGILTNNQDDSSESNTSQYNETPNPHYKSKSLRFFAPNEDNEPAGFFDRHTQMHPVAEISGNDEPIDVEGDNELQNNDTNMEDDTESQHISVANSRRAEAHTYRNGMEQTMEESEIEVANENVGFRRPCSKAFSLQPRASQVSVTGLKTALITSMDNTTINQIEKTLSKAESSNSREGLSKQALPRKTIPCSGCCIPVWNDKNSMLRHINKRHLKLRQFTCTQCDKTFDSSKSASAHVRLGHGGNTLTDYMTDHTSENEPLLEQYLEKLFPGRVIVNEAENSFADDGPSHSRRGSIKQAIRKKKIQCFGCCINVSNDRSSMLCHINKRHLKLPLFTCTECDESFHSTKFSALAHVRKAHGGNVSTLTDHRTANEPILVQYMEKFFQTSTVQSHEKKSSTQQSVASAECREQTLKETSKRKSPRKSILRTKSARSQARGKLQCAECNMWLQKSEYNLKFHINSKHLRLPLYKCRECDHEFYSSLESVRVHTKRHHQGGNNLIDASNHGSNWRKLDSLMKDFFPTFCRKIS